MGYIIYSGKNQPMYYFAAKNFKNSFICRKTFEKCQICLNSSVILCSPSFLSQNDPYISRKSEKRGLGRAFATPEITSLIFGVWTVTPIIREGVSILRVVVHDHFRDVILWRGR